MTNEVIRNRKLRLLVQNDSENLFVRLPLQTANDLSPRHSDTGFIPLSISLSDHTIFASWNGGLVSEADTIEVPKALLPLELSSFPSKATVQVLPSIPRCKRVYVEPFRAEDWELLETYAKKLESGLLLQQISVVYRKQKLILTIQKDKIEISIQNISIVEEEGLDKPGDVDFGLLLQDTEVIISPKVRTSSLLVDWTPPQRLIPCQDEWDDTMLELQTISKSTPLIVPPACVMVNDNLWTTNFEWAMLESNDLPEKKRQIVKVVRDPNIPRGQAALHPSLRIALGLQLYWHSIRLRPTSDPEIIPIQSVKFCPIQIDTDRTLPRYRRPFAKSPKETGSAAQWPSFQSTTETRSLLPVNSIMTLPNTLRNNSSMVQVLHDKKGLDHDSLGMIIDVQQDEQFLLLQQRFEEVKDEQPKLQLKAETDVLATSLPYTILASLEWATEICQEIQWNPNTMVTMCGPNGSGKTYSSLFVCALARLEQHTATLYLDCKSLQESLSTLSEILDELDLIFERAARAGKCILVLDDLEKLAPNLLGEEGNDASARIHGVNPLAITQSKVISDRLLQLIEACQLQQSDVSILITCSRPESINHALLRSSLLFQMRTTVPILTPQDRFDLLRRMLQPLTPRIDSNALARQTEGYRPRDLEKIASRIQQKLRLGPNESMEDIIKIVLKDYTPLSHISLNQKETVSSLSWESVGGLFTVKTKLESTIMQPVKYRLIYEQASVKLPRGILLFGPSGCGKSTLLPALAKECNFSLISCKGPEVLDKYIGASEAKIRELFERASDVAPSILFLDELDALAPRRGSDHTGVTDRIVNQLLTFLDGVEDTSSKSRVYIIGATSRPDKIDSALLRPGRLEQHLYVGLPESDEELYDLFTKVLDCWSLTEECQSIVTSKTAAMDLLRVNPQIHRFSPADFKAVLNTAHVNAVHESLRTAKPEEIKQVLISERNLRLALLSTRPSLLAEDYSALDNVYKTFMGEKGKVVRREKKELKTTLK